MFTLSLDKVDKEEERKQEMENFLKEPGAPWPFKIGMLPSLLKAEDCAQNLQLTHLQGGWDEGKHIGMSELVQVSIPRVNIGRYIDQCRG